MNYPEEFGITENQYQSIEDYLNTMLEVNKSINLTRINSFKDSQILHIEDSLYALNYVKDAIPGDYADRRPAWYPIESGAGAGPGRLTGAAGSFRRGRTGAFPAGGSRPPRLPEAADRG